MKLAFLFPGQGSQYVGMGQEFIKEFPVAKKVFEEIDESLGFHLSNVIFNGPIEELTLTANTQPALMGVSLAIFKVLEKEGGDELINKVKFLAGHSLGEYSALTVAGSFGLSEAASILRIRGEAMQKAVPFGKGGMAAIMGIDMPLAEEIANIAAEEQVCSVANDNSVGQIVLSGESSAIDRAIEIAKTKGARRAILLPVSAPFHCKMMGDAADTMEKELSNMTINEPSIPVVSNVTANIATKPTEIVRLLVEQVTARVRWRESILFMKENGVDTFIEIGAGKVLTGLTRRIDADLRSISIQDVSDIDKLLETL